MKFFFFFLDIKLQIENVNDTVSFFDLYGVIITVGHVINPIKPEDEKKKHQSDAVEHDNFRHCANEFIETKNKMTVQFYHRQKH